MACKESLSEILKESLCSQLPTMEIEEEIDEAYLEGGLIHYLWGGPTPEFYEVVIE